jgi:hypothetical protein
MHPQFENHQYINVVKIGTRYYKIIYQFFYKEVAKLSSVLLKKCGLALLVLVQ